MAYSKQNFVNGQILNDIHLINIENGIIDVEGDISAIEGDISAINEQIAKKIGFVRTLTSADDMNDIKTDGVYVYSTSSLPVNAPYENASVVFVFGSTSTSSQKIQIGVRYGAVGKMSFRALYSSAWKDWAEVAIAENGIVQLANGGTGAATRKTAMYNIASIGENPITSTTNDTTAKWAELGTGYAFYNATGQLNDQQGQWGFLCNIVHGAEVFQIWNSQSGGATYFRSGNADGFNNSWRKVLDTSVTKDYITAQGTSGIWTYRKWNSGIAECWGTPAQRSMSCSTAWGGVYTTSDAFLAEYTYPFTFTAVPNVSALAKATSSGGDFWLVSSAAHAGSKTNTPAFYAVRGSSGTAAGSVYLYAIGKWK